MRIVDSTVEMFPYHRGLSSRICLPAQFISYETSAYSSYHSSYAPYRHNEGPKSRNLSICQRFTILLNIADIQEIFNDLQESKFELKKWKKIGNKNAFQ